MKAGQLLRQLLVVGVLLGLWQIVYRLNVYPDASFPSLFEVLHALGKELFQGALFRQLLVTIRMIIAGLFA